MKVHELIEALKNADPNADVVIQEQPTYATVYKVQSVVIGSEVPSGDDGQTDERHKNRVYLLEGSYLGYGSRKLWDL